MSQNYKTHKKYTCINPYHYGYDVNANSDYNETENHDCMENVKLQISGLSTNTMCKVCGRILTEADEQELMKVKMIPEDKKHLEEVTIEDLDNEFQGMLDSIEEQVNDELAQVTTSKEEPANEEDMDETEDIELEENKANLHLELGLAFSLNESNEPAEKSKKRPLVEETQESAGEKKKIKLENIEDLEHKAVEEKPVDKDHQCDQCLEWFKDKQELDQHSCLDALKIHGKIMYACHFCATSSNDLESLRPHVVKCKQFNLAALRCFQKYESAMTTTTLSSVSVEASSPVRSRGRMKKGDHQPSKCEQCSVTFQTKSELVLHNSKAKCKSHECPKCHKFFANERTLKNHQHCDDAQVDEMADKTQVDQDIKVIKLDKTKMFHQVTNLLKSCFLA